MAEQTALSRERIHVVGDLIMLTLLRVIAAIVTIDEKKEVNKEWVNWIRNQDGPSAETKIKAGESIRYSSLEAV